MKRAQNINTRTTQETLVDPDPFVIILGILGAVGSIASLIQYVEGKFDKYKKEKSELLKIYRQIADLLSNIEADKRKMENLLKELEAILRKVDHVKYKKLKEMPFEFGGCKPLFGRIEYESFKTILADIHNIVSRTFGNVLKLIEYLRVIDSLFYKDIGEELNSLQFKCNNLLRGKLSYEEGFNLYYNLLVYSNNILRNMRQQVENKIKDMS